MAIYDDLKTFASQYPNRNQNFMLKIKLNSTTGLYEIVFEPYNYMPYTNAPTWTTTPNPHTAGCPPGQVMGPDGVCRVSTDFTGQPTTPDPETPELGPALPSPETPDNTTNVFAGSGAGGGGVQPSYYEEQEALYKSVSEGTAGRKDKYKTLPGGMNNWTESQLFQFGLDNNYFTGGERLGMDIADFEKQIPNPGEHRYADYNSKLEDYFNKTMIGQVLHKITDPFAKKQFNNWLNLMTDENRPGGPVIKKQEDGSWKIIKGPGDNPNALYAGGYLKPLDEFKQAETDYAKDYFTPAGVDETITSENVSGTVDDLTYDWAMRFKLGNEYLPELRNDQQIDMLNNNIEKWQTKLAEMHATGEGTGWWEIFDKPEMDNLAQNIKTAEERIVFLSPKTTGFESYTPGNFDLQKNYQWGTINYKDGRQIPIEELSKMTGKEQTDFWKAQAGISLTQQDKFQLTGSPHTEQPRIVSTEMIAPGAKTKVNLSTPTTTSSMNSSQVNSIFGTQSAEVTRLVGGIFDKEQHTDRVISSNDNSPGNRNQDGSTKDWGYDADGRFVNIRTGKTAAHGSYDDAIKAIKNGTASSTLLDRFAWGGTANKKNTSGYLSKEAYMADQKNKVVYRNNEGEQTVVNATEYNQGNPGISKDDNSKGSRKSKIICDYFYRKGLLSEKIWKADEAYGEHLMKTEPLTMNGYHTWARHYVREMEKESILGKVYFAWAKLWVPHWAKYLAGEKTIRGKILHSIGKPICNVLGKFNRRLKWQQA